MSRDRPRQRLNRSEASLQDVQECAQAYVAVTDPDLHNHLPNSLSEVKLRSTHDQPSYQQEVFHDLTRAAALFGLTAAPPGRASLVITAGWDEDLFGCPLSDYSRTQATGWNCRGDPNLRTLPDLAGDTRPWLAWHDLCLDDADHYRRQREQPIPRG